MSLSSDKPRGLVFINPGGLGWMSVLLDSIGLWFIELFILDDFGQSSDTSRGQGCI